jgi:hypothetical protein
MTVSAVSRHNLLSAITVHDRFDHARENDVEVVAGVAGPI